MTDFAGTLRGLPPESRMAGGSAAALAASLLLPWYQVDIPTRGGFNRSAFEVFSWVEGAVLLVAAGVLYLVWARAERRAFHLPGGDGFVVSLAGGWALVLLIWRLFDRPGVSGEGATVGVQWGIFLAMLAAGALAAAGARVRAAGRPEPRNPAADEPGWETPARRARRAEGRPQAHAAVTEVLKERPGWQGDPPEAPGRGPKPPPEPPPPPARRRRRREPPPPADRLF